jgi:ketosteroid isomerase-like protein
MVHASMVRRTALLVMLVASLLATGICQGTEQDAKSVAKTREEILKIEDEANQAVKNRNSGRLDSLFADELVWLTTRGEIFTKPQVLDDVQSGKQTGLLDKTDDKQLHVHGDTVILYTATKAQAGSKEERSPRMTTTVFVKKDGLWKIVAHGETVVLPQ